MLKSSICQLQGACLFRFAVRTVNVVENYTFRVKNTQKPGQAAAAETASPKVEE